MPPVFWKFYAESAKKALILKLEAKQAQLKKRLKYLKNEIKKLEIENNKLRAQFEGTQEQD